MADYEYPPANDPMTVLTHRNFLSALQFCLREKADKYQTKAMEYASPQAFERASIYREIADIIQSVKP